MRGHLLQGAFRSFVRAIGRYLPGFITLLCLASPSTAYEVLVLKSADVKPYQDSLEGFKRTCGCTVTELSLRDMEKNGITKKAAAAKADAVLAIGIDALKAVRAIKDIPVVYTLVPTHPDATEQKNLSGVSMVIPADKQLDSMLRTFPSARNIGCIFDAKYSDAFVKDAVQAAKARGVELVLSRVQSPAEVPSKIDAMKNRVDVFWMLPDLTVANAETANYILLFSFKNRVPVFTFSKKYLDQGAVAALVVDPEDLGMQAGEIMKKVLSASGERSRILQDARKAVPLVNKRIADKLGIRLGEDFLELVGYGK
jgi:putative ABC transport system substrate-binding protein